MDPAQLLRERAALLGLIRKFFDQRGVIEVETPVLLSEIAPDPFIEYFHVPLTNTQDADQPRFLAASPEAQMKRLLCMGSGPIYQLARAFRKNELGRWHNPEFTMLEWYRPDCQCPQLIAEAAALTDRVTNRKNKLKIYTYKDLFMQIIGLNPHCASLDELHLVVNKYSGADTVALNHRSQFLHCLFGTVIEPQLGSYELEAVIDYPLSEAVSAATGINADGEQIAQRFELYFHGVELANGNLEEASAKTLEQRFERVLEQWPDDSPKPAIDRRFLDAWNDACLPATAGIAMGVDRLLALTGRGDNLPQVLPLNWHSV